MLSLPIHLPYCCQSSLFKRKIWSCSKTFDCSLPLVKVQIFCVGNQSSSQVNNLSFFISHHIPTFPSPMGQLRIPYAYNELSYWTLHCGCLCQSPYLACQAVFWSSGQAHLVHISIITHHAVLHLLLFFPVSPMDHELFVYNNYIWLTSVFPELSTGPHRNNESAKDCLLFLMA